MRNTIVSDVMKPVVTTVAPQCPIAEIEDKFTKHAISTLPVVEDGKLVGILSQSDIIRRICVERSVSEVIAAYDWDISGFDRNPSESETITEIAERLGRRIEHLKATDVMTPNVISIAPQETIKSAARIMIDNHIHRLPVVQNEQLIGLVSSMDLVRYVAAADDKDRG